MSSPFNLKKTLLASTCLTALTMGSAQATVVNEATDFANSLGAATTLPTGTTQVLGSFNFSDSGDFFALTGLTPGALVTVSYVGDAEGGPSSFNAYTSLDPDSSFTPVFDSEGSEVLTVGSAGLVAIGQSFNCGDCFNIGYTIDISVQNPQVQVPVAPTAALIGVGVAAMGLRRRKHSAK
jgi:hypothetical protein